jgi:hypothetical protein
MKTNRARNILGAVRGCVRGEYDMKRMVIGCTVAAILLLHGVASACSIQNRKEAQIGDSKGVTGVCSNNGLPISCMFIKGEGITCDGPAGGVNGDDLNALIFSACGCSEQEERELCDRCRRIR